MKKLKLGTYKPNGVAEPQAIAATLVGIVELAPIDRNNPNAGFTFSEIRRRARVCEALERATDEVVLDDADYDVLRNALEQFSMRTVDRAFLAIEDAVLNAEDFTPAASPHRKELVAQ